MKSLVVDVHPFDMYVKLNGLAENEEIFTWRNLTEIGGIFYRQTTEVMPVTEEGLQMLSGK